MKEGRLVWDVGDPVAVILTTWPLQQLGRPGRTGRGGAGRPSATSAPSIIPAASLLAIEG